MQLGFFIYGSFFVNCESKFVKIVQLNSLKLMNHSHSGQSEFLTKATGIIGKNLKNEHFGVSELAGEMNTSRASLYRKIKASSGMSANRFICKVRLESAMDLLQNSEMNISEIAFVCGFNSLSYFSKCFREQYGHSPRQARSDLITESVNRSNLHNLPVMVTSFINRKVEMETVTGLLIGHRMVSLTGTGGCGKTRLACEVAERMEKNFSDGVWFVNLAPVETGDMVEKEVAETLEVQEIPGHDLMDTVVDKTSGKQMLIILDNCEHVVKEAAEVAGRLVRSGNGIRILATSRTALNIRGEKACRVPSLSLPDPDKILHAGQATGSEAVQLFADRAKLSDTRFELTDSNFCDVAAICKKTDGIPLAIELVASHTRYMDPVTLLERLSSRFSALSSPDPGTIKRHKTVKASIDWSYDLLKRDEKELFRRLSAFSGNFDLSAAEKICYCKSLLREQILDLLAGLLDRSMINTIRDKDQKMRYYLLETLRQYGAELLTEKEAGKLRKRHYDYYRDLAEQAWRERLIRQSAWMNRIRLEHDNLLAALNWSEHSNPDLFAGMAAALSWFWVKSNNLKLAKKTLEKVISGKNGGNEVQARALRSYAWVTGATNVKNIVKSIQLMEKSRNIWHRINNKNEEVIALSDLAIFYYGNGDDKTGLAYAEQAYKLAQIENDPGVLLYSMFPLSQGRTNMKQFSDARAMAAKILKTGKEMGNLFAQFIGHHNRADCALMQGKFHESEKQYVKGLGIVTKFGDMHYTFIELTGVAMSLAGQGRYKKALQLTGAVKELTKTLGMGSPEDMKLSFWQEMVKKHLTGTRQKLGDRKAGKYRDQGRNMSLEETIRYAMDIEKD